MIDIQSLHIGSHVLLVDNEIVPGITYLEKGVRYKVTGIDSFNNLISLGDKYEERYGIKHALSFNPDNLAPIPITEELLAEISAGKHEKSNKVGDYFVCVWTIGEYQIEFRIIGERNIVVIRDYAEPQTLIAESMNIRYLHELEAFIYLTTKQRLI